GLPILGRTAGIRFVTECAIQLGRSRKRRIDESGHGLGITHDLVAPHLDGLCRQRRMLLHLLHQALDPFPDRLPLEELPAHTSPTESVQRPPHFLASPRPVGEHQEAFTADELLRHVRPVGAGERLRLQLHRVSGLAGSEPAVQRDEHLQTAQVIGDLVRRHAERIDLDRRPPVFIDNHRPRRQLDRARHTERVRLRVLHRLPPEPYHLLRAPYGAARKAPVAVDEDPYTGCQLLPVQRIEDVLVHDTPSLVRQADVRIRGASVLGCFDRPAGELLDAHVPDRGYRRGTPPKYATSGRGIATSAAAPTPALSRSRLLIVMPPRSSVTGSRPRSPPHARHARSTCFDTCRRPARGTAGPPSRTAAAAG